MTTQKKLFPAIALVLLFSCTVNANPLITGTAETMLFGEKKTSKQMAKQEVSPVKKEPAIKLAAKPEKKKNIQTQLQTKQPKTELLTQQRNNVQVVDGVKVDCNQCRFVPELNSVTCNMTLTSLENDKDVVFYCYTGTAALDTNKNLLRCGQTWIGSNHSWNFAHGRLQQGTPEKAMVRMETRNITKTLSTLQLVVAVDGQRKAVQMTDVPVIN